MTTTLAGLLAGLNRPLVRRDYPMTWVADDLLLVCGPRHAVPVRCDRAAAAWARAVDGTRTTAELLYAVSDAPATFTAMATDVMRAAAACGVLDDAAALPRSWRLIGPNERQRLEPDLLAAHHVYGDARTARSAIDRRTETRVAVVGSGAIADAARTVVASSGLRPADLDTAQVALLCDGSPPEVVTDFGAAEHLGPHLPISVFGARALVGPLVVPGVTSCLRCAHLHHCDADTGWSLRSAQLALLAPALTTAPVDRLLAYAAAVMAVGLVRAWVDGVGHEHDLDETVGGVVDGVAGEPGIFDVAYELRLPFMLARALARPAHPLCGCQWPAE